MLMRAVSGVLSGTLAVSAASLPTRCDNSTSVIARNLASFAEAQDLNSPYPFYFPVLQNGTASNSGQFPMPLCNGFKLEEATIDQMQAAFANGTLTTVSLVLCYIRRIQQTDFYLEYVYLPVFLYHLLIPA